MNHFIVTNNLSEHIKKELEAIQKLILPLAKKTSKYMFWTYPLIGISLINIVYLLFFAPEFMDNKFLLILYSILGALGLALYKEIRLNKKEIQKIGTQYIIERMKKSRFVGEDRKTYYIRTVEKLPVQALDFFIRFLQEEERNKREFAQEHSEQSMESSEQD